MTYDKFLDELEAGYCPLCGNKVNHNYCEECGIDFVTFDYEEYMKDLYIESEIDTYMDR